MRPMNRLRVKCDSRLVIEATIQSALVATQKTAIEISTETGSNEAVNAQTETDSKSVNAPSIK